MQNWLAYTVAELGLGIAERRIDPVELTESFLQAIESHELSHRIYSRVTRERAVAEAKASRQRALDDQRLSLIDGVPISWKDLFDTAQTATESGSLLLKDRMPSQDAIVLQTARQSGLVCLGKTHMSELAFSGLGLNPMLETPPNIHRHDAAPGGSSSGAAASVAFNLAAAAIGSDTGGSVRIPAAWNDLVGLKTTHGRLSLKGVVPLCESFDTVGPLCRNVEDTSLVFKALTGSQVTRSQPVEISQCRFATLETVVLNEIQSIPLMAYEQSLEKLRQAGATIEPLAVIELERALDLAAVLYSAEAYAEWREEIEAAPEKMYQMILNRFRSGKDVSAPDYIAAWSKLRQIRSLWKNACTPYDGVLAPTIPNLPPDLNRLQSEEAYYLRENQMALRNTRIANLMGICALTVPTAVSSCGIMIMGKASQEEALLRYGASIELMLT
ncbi:MAG: amidase family protein [Aestuariivita sp.]|nr:amidase family protein [Aestuariivita sp.]MCY4347537.1 amidase family protein [Aestuariivita sp.]